MPRSRNSGDGIDDTPIFPGLHSTINPDKLDEARFTEIRENENDSNPMRIVIFVIVVIVIGVGAALIIRSAFGNNTQNTDNQQTTDDTNNNETVTPSALTINTTVKSDSLATNLSKNTDYIDAETTQIGETLSMIDVSLDKINVDRYTTFARLSFTFSGNAQKAPTTKATYKASTDNLTLEFVGLTKINNDLKTSVNVNNLIKSLAYQTDSAKYQINFEEDSKYRLFQVNGVVIVDVKTEKELAKDTTTEDTTEDDSSTDTNTDTNTDNTPTNTNNNTSNNTGKPAAPHYTNEFSQIKQFISSKVSGNKVALNRYFTWDEGTFFEFSFGQNGSVGDDFIPNSTAYLEEKDGKNYIVWEIENLSQEVFTSSNATSRTAGQIEEVTGVGLSAANFVRIDLVSYQNGMAKYRIELKKKADFKLMTQKTYDGKTQIQSLQIKD